MTDEIIRLYENAGIKPYIYCSKPQLDCDARETGNCKQDCEYYSGRRTLITFTAEKQLEIENVILQNKKNYNKWIEYNINVYGEWVIRFVRTDKFAPYIALEKTRAEAFANVINYLWQDLTEEEKQQVKGILE